MLTYIYIYSTDKFLVGLKFWTSWGPDKKIKNIFLVGFFLNRSKSNKFYRDFFFKIDGDFNLKGFS